MSIRVSSVEVESRLQQIPHRVKPEGLGFIAAMIAHNYSRQGTPIDEVTDSVLLAEVAQMERAWRNQFYSDAELENVRDKIVSPKSPPKIMTAKEIRMARKAEQERFTAMFAAEDRSKAGRPIPDCREPMRQPKRRDRTRGGVKMSAPTITISNTQTDET